ncbi:hypothetical protein MPC1_6700004 [Methylocella tundrae]|nr:hypothetical protein MPC1_6700004 [Methylocella tundrae]
MSMRVFVSSALVFVPWRPQAIEVTLELS